MANLTHSCLFRNDGQLQGYLQGTRSIFLSPFLSSSSNNNNVIYQSFKPSSYSVSPSSSSLVSKMNDCIFNVEATCSSTNRGLKYQLNVKAGNNVNINTTQLGLAIDLYHAIWTDGVISVGKKPILNIKESEMKGESWKGPHINVNTSFNTSMSVTLSQDGREPEDIQWHAVPNQSKNEVTFLRLNVTLCSSEWEKNQERKFELSLTFNGWDTNLQPKGSITEAQKNHLFEEGYVVIENMVSEDICDNLVRAINHQMGLTALMAKKEKSRNHSDKQKGGKRGKGKNAKHQDKEEKEEISDQKEEPKARQGNIGNFFPALKQSPLLLDLINGTQILDVLETLLGAGNVMTQKSGQIALRHPTTQDPAVVRLAKNSAPAVPSAFTKAEYHIDGKNDGENSIPVGTIGSFTLLVGVLLKDLPKQESGNLIVYPRTHWKHASYFRRDTPESFLIGEGMPKYFTQDGQLPKSLQLCGKKGDIVLAHYMLGHSVSPNYSTDIRYKTYFRVSTDSLAEVKKNKDNKHESMVKLWQDWKGMQDYSQKRGMDDFYTLKD